MDQIPQLTNVSLMYRRVLNKVETYLVFPIKNPSYYQVLGLCLSILYLFSSTILIQSATIAVILLLDWLDGAVARRYKLVSKQGWMIDVAVDRMSEGFIFVRHFLTPLGLLFFVLYLFNILLSIYCVKSAKHLILPLRFVWLIILLSKLWIF